jgi:hypothetical protein
VVSIGDMLQFKKYNIRSPLNAVAAEWANSFAATLPIGNVELGVNLVPLRIQVQKSSNEFAASDKKESQ